MTNIKSTTPFDFYVKNIQHYYNRNSVLEVIGKNIPPEFEDVAEIILSNLDQEPLKGTELATKHENYNKAILTRVFCSMFKDKDNDDYFGELFENLLGNFDLTGSIHLHDLNLSEKLSKFKTKAGEIGKRAYVKAGEIGEHAYVKAGEIGEHAYVNYVKAGEIGEHAYDRAGNAKNKLRLKIKYKFNKDTDITDIQIFEHYLRFIEEIRRDSRI